MRTIAISSKKIWIKDAGIGILASFLLGASSILSFPLPFTPVPVTIQSQLALFLAALMGPRRGAWMVASFLAQGAMGLPVFAGGAGTLAILFGPRGGYLMGYLLAAYAVGKMHERYNLFLSMLTGNMIVYACGMIWLAQFVGVQKAFLLGVTPF